MDMDGIYVAKIPFKLWLKLNDPEYEVFRRSSNMIYDFVSEVKTPPTGKVIDKLIKPWYIAIFDKKKGCFLLLLLLYNVYTVTSIVHFSFLFTS